MLTSSSCSGEPFSVDCVTNADHLGVLRSVLTLFDNWIRGSDPKATQDMFNEANNMMFSGALQAHYYQTHGHMTVVGEPMKGKMLADSDADDEEEEPEWVPPKKGTKRGLAKKDDDGEPPRRTAADDEYEQENNFDDINDMVKTAQLQGYELSNSLSAAEESQRSKMNSAATSDGKQTDLAATGRSASAYSAKSAVSSGSGAPSTPATPSTAATQQQAQTPMTPFSTIHDQSNSALEITGASTTTGSQLNQVCSLPAGFMRAFTD